MFHTFNTKLQKLWSCASQSMTCFQQMSVTLHGFIGSPPLRSAIMVCEALDVKYTLKEVDPFRREHFSPEYLKLCPIHSIPVLEDGDYVLFDSHAIACYLANKYGKDEKWYPIDPKKRGIVDQRLHFTNGMLILPFKELMVPLLTGQSSEFKPYSIKKVKEGLRQLETLLGDNAFLTGNGPTIADCCASSAVFSIQAVLPQLVTDRLSAWMQRCETTLPGYNKVHQPALSSLSFFKPSKL